MSLPNSVQMTRDGGRYYRAHAWSMSLTLCLLPFVLVLTIAALINPFWFRDSMFNWLEKKVNRFVRWRNKKAYGIYLGCDPDIWHALKSTQK